MERPVAEERAVYESRKRQTCRVPFSSLLVIGSPLVVVVMMVLRVSLWTNPDSWCRGNDGDWTGRGHWERV